MKSFCYCLFLALILSGCATGAKYQVNVGNDNPEWPVQNVQVLLDDKTEYEFARIAPSKVAAAKPKKGEIPKEVTVTWQDVNGEKFEAVMVIDTTMIRPDFKGQLVLAITVENTVTITEVPSEGKELSTMPWAMPESWEGSVSIPGMDDI
ncbi:hypothetical protein P3T73_10550 [Kiritimatiellota bacterium B12222]|nr:hypothetical protein P3T73_10550 [Kiritimatiellota bacterium B12222]